MRPTLSFFASRILLSALMCLLLAPGNASAEPPFHGTIFLAPNLITEADPTNFTNLQYIGHGQRSMFDRRTVTFVEREAYLFDARYNDGLSIEIQVNPEFGSPEAAQKEAAFYAAVIGRLPRNLRVDVQTVWIHRGDHLFGGGNNNLLIHTGSIAQSYIADGILEEALIHEATHTSLDGAHAASPGWLAAQAADPEFISTYARDNPAREDLAETVLLWMALRYRPQALTPELKRILKKTIPHRLAYFDTLADGKPANVK